MGKEAFLPQIPLHVLAEISRNGKVNYGIKQSHAALLFTDISGFTKLTETLTAEGKEGIEEVTQILNSHFSRISTILDAHKGILLKMGGDSLLARFTGADAVDRATSAAWRMLDWFKENPKISTSKGTFPLTMKAILGGGSYYEALLGNDEKANWFPIGKELEDIAKAEKEVQPGSFVLKQGIKDIDFPNEPYPVISAENRLQLAELTACFLPMGKSKKLTISAGGEYRVAATVFINFKGYNPANPDFNELNSFYLNLYKLVDHYHGAIDKIDISPQGSKILVLFGAPIGHEKDRANAAEFFHKLSSFATPFTMKAGLSYGSLFAGFIGGNEKEYTVIGQRVNAAAKMMSASSENEFMITQEAADKLSDLFEMKEHNTVQVGGVVYRRFQLSRPKKAEERLSKQWKIHNEELALCKEFATGDTKVIGIQADHGMGKSIFLRRLAVDLMVSTNVLDVSIDERGAPYQVFRRILIKESGIKEEDSPEEKERKLNLHIEQLIKKTGGHKEHDELARRLPFIAAMLFAVESASERIASYSPELRVENLMDAFRTYLVKMALLRPLSLLIDNLDQADAGSLEMIAFAARTIPRLKPQGVYFYTTFNSEFAEMFNQGFLSDNLKVEIVSLNPLSTAKSRELAEHILGSPADEAIHQFLYQHSVGNPTVLEQWAGYLIDKGLIEKTAEGWTMKAVEADTEIPDDIYSLVFSRLDRLPADTRQALKLGSVYGMHFPASLLSKVLARHDIEALFEKAVQAGLVYPLEAGDLEYVFKQSMVKDVCYDSLLREERETFHRKIAIAIEDMYSASLERYYSMLSHHSMEAQDWDRAFNYSLKSAAENRRLFRNEDAEHDYSQAINIWETHFKEGRSEEIFDAHFGLAQVFEYQGKFPEASHEYSASHKLAIKVGATEKAVDSLNKLAYVSRFMSDFKNLFEYADNALKRAQAIDYKKGMAMALLEQGSGYARQGNLEQAHSDFTNALELLKSLDDPVNSNRALNNLATLSRFQGRPDLSLDYYEKAIALAEKSEDKLLLTNNILNIARLLFQMGRLDEAGSYLERALKIAMDIGHRQTIINCTVELAGVERMRGEHEASEARLEEAWIRAEELQNPQISGEVAMRRGNFAFYEGRPDEALKFYSLALNFRQLIGDPGLMADTHTKLGNALQALGRMQEARTHLDEAYNLFKETGDQAVIVETLVLLSSLNIHLGNVNEGLAKAKEALEVAKQSGDSWIEANARIQFAAANAQVDNYQEALEALDFADEIAKVPEMALLASEALGSKASLYAKLGQFEKGLNQAEQAIEIAKSSENPEILVNAITARLENLIGKKDLDTALSELMKLQELCKQQEQESSDITCKLMAARINLINQVFEPAIELLTTILTEHGDTLGKPKQWEIRSLLIEAYLESEKFSDAANIADELLKEVNDCLSLRATAHIALAWRCAPKLGIKRSATQVKLGFFQKLFHMKAATNWKNNQQVAASCIKKISSRFSEQNSQSFKALFINKGLIESLN